MSRPRRGLAALVLAGVSGCGGTASPPAFVDTHVTPPVEDPIRCPESRLRDFALRIPGATLTVSLEPIVEASRIDSIPCPAGTDDAACLRRARSRPVPVGFTVTGVTIGGDVSHVAATYDVDGVRRVEEVASFEVLVPKLRALQAQGHQVVLIDAHVVVASEARHARLVLTREGGRQRRVGELRWIPAERAQASAEAQGAAEQARMEVRSLESVEDELVMIATCAD